MRGLPRPTVLIACAVPLLVCLGACGTTSSAVRLTPPADVLARVRAATRSSSERTVPANQIASGTSGTTASNGGDVDVPEGRLSTDPSLSAVTATASATSPVSGQGSLSGDVNAPVDVPPALVANGDGTLGFAPGELAYANRSSGAPAGPIAQESPPEVTVSPRDGLGLRLGLNIPIGLGVGALSIFELSTICPDYGLGVHECGQDTQFLLSVFVMANTFAASMVQWALSSAFHGRGNGLMSVGIAVASGQLVALANLGNTSSNYVNSGRSAFVIMMAASAVSTGVFEAVYEITNRRSALRDLSEAAPRPSFALFPSISPVISGSRVTGAMLGLSVAHF